MLVKYLYEANQGDVRNLNVLGGKHNPEIKLLQADKISCWHIFQHTLICLHPKANAKKILETGTTLYEICIDIYL